MTSRARLVKLTFCRLCGWSALTIINVIIIKIINMIFIIIIVRAWGALKAQNHFVKMRGSVHGQNHISENHILILQDKRIWTPFFLLTEEKCIQLHPIDHFTLILKMRWCLHRIILSKIKPRTSKLYLMLRKKGSKLSWQALEKSTNVFVRWVNINRFSGWMKEVHY